jgi:carboxymethylenebutenolidase
MATMIEIATTDGPISAYRAEPTGEARGAIIVIHEIWGLVDHIKEVADRYAAEGYLVVAPDLLSKVGMNAAAGEELRALVMNPDEATRVAAQPLMREKLAPVGSPEFGAWATTTLTKVVDYLDAQSGIDGRIAVLGFCFGGTYAFALAAADPRVRASLPFYGQPPETAQLGAIACPVLAFYGDQDARLMETLPGVTAALKDAGVDFEAKVYAGAQHAFFNDSNAATSYDPAAAADSWTRSLAFLDGSL